MIAPIALMTRSYGRSVAISPVVRRSEQARPSCRETHRLDGQLRQDPLSDLAVPSIALPNGSRLSCGRNARGRKEVQRQINRPASEATQFFPRERPAASSAC